MVKKLKSSKYKLVNFKSVLGGDFKDEILILNGKISESTGNLEENKIKKIDCKNCIICPGFIDVQVNGAFDCNFWDLESLTFEKIDNLRLKLALAGVVAFCPTIITSKQEKIVKTIDFLNTYIKQASNDCGARVLGIHVEGIFITNYGVHEKKFARSELSIKNIEPFVKENVVIFTYAPELDLNGEVARYLQKNKILPSIGHSNASYREGIKAIKDHGVNTVTHMFNALRGVKGFHHRDIEKSDSKILLGKLTDEKNVNPDEDGIMLALLKEKEVLCTVIADGKHVGNEALSILKIYKNKNGVALISDLVPRDFYEKEALRGVLGGGQVTLDECVKNLTSWGICNIQDSLYSASVPISNRLNVANKSGLGKVELGINANLVIWNIEKNKVAGTIIGENIFLKEIGVRQ